MKSELRCFTEDNCNACRKTCSTNELYNNFCNDVDGECPKYKDKLEETK